eukprot:13307900-Alexandrium_andersonii.AAC.1
MVPVSEEPRHGLASQWRCARSLAPARNGLRRRAVWNKPPCQGALYCDSAKARRSKWVSGKARGRSG